MDVLRPAQWLIVMAQALFHPPCFAFPCLKVSNAVPFGSHSCDPVEVCLTWSHSVSGTFVVLGIQLQPCRASNNSFSAGPRPWVSTYLSLLCGFKGMGGCMHGLLWVLPGRHQVAALHISYWPHCLEVDSVSKGFQRTHVSSKRSKNKLWKNCHWGHSGKEAASLSVEGLALVVMTMACGDLHKEALEMPLFHTVMFAKMYVL